MKIFPSLISGDLLNLANEVQQLEPHCAGFHIDIMDFHFVPNLTWGPDFANALRAATKKQLWIDLLVEHPEKYLKRLHLNKNDIVSIHYESKHAPDTLKKIHAQGWLASIALDPNTPVNAIEPLLDQIDHVLIMSVKPGFSGQKFIPKSIDRLQELHMLKNKHNANFIIGMDGGLNKQTLPLVAPYELDMAALAKGIFGEKDPIQALKELSRVS